MARTGVGFRAASAAVAVLLMLFSVGFSFAVVQDYTDRDVCPKGARVEGVPVGGLARAAAVRRVRDTVEAELMKPLTVATRGASNTFDPAASLKMDTEGMVAETLRPQERATLLQRAYRRLTGESVQVDVRRKLRIDPAPLRLWLAHVAKDVDLMPVDAKLTVSGHAVHISKSRVGYRLDLRANEAVVTKALLNGRRDVRLAVATLRPKVTERSLGKTIVVQRSTRHLWLYDGEKLEKDFPVAVGMPEWPTPLGWWHVVEKEYMPTWHNPHSAWSGNMPDTIGPGYGNPLGTRALALDASGVLIHGTANDGSIGTAASHGCIRMHMSDVEDLFERVEAGTRVVIVD